MTRKCKYIYILYQIIKVMLLQGCSVELNIVCDNTRQLACYPFRQTFNVQQVRLDL